MPVRLVLATLVAWAALSLGDAAAQGTVPPDAPPPAAAAAPAAVRVVGRVSVSGNLAVDSARVVRSFEVWPGSRYSPDAVRRGLRKLFALGLFRDAWVDSRERGDTLDLVIHVVERPRIRSIAFSGNRKRESSELEKKLFLKVAEPWSSQALQTQVDTLLQYYRDQGFPRAQVRAATDSTTTPGQMAITFQVVEGERFRIRRIEFRGAEAFSAGRLRKALGTKAKGFFGGGSITDEGFAEDKEKLASFYHNRGYRDARVVGHELTPGRKPRDLILSFEIEEGPRYSIGEIAWTGNTVVPEATLRRLWTPRAGDPYDLSRIEKAQGQAFAEYAELGYLYYLNIESSEAVIGTAVNVEFRITEGEPSNVRYVRIAGNHATREKVIRREIDLHEGERFKRSALIRSQGDVFRLGFFEDVQVDFAPAESTDVDITLTVKEKQVGTASAGAGYTGEGGLTGFLQLGHNNVLGNGQSLQLHLERGARRSDYYLSFTEPWFRDTPTLLGFSVFNTDRVRDLFDENRRGGSVRIGRPLPWPDYSRGSISYRLEDVVIKIDRPESQFTARDSIVLRGLRSGEPVRTSSVEGFFVRNSTNNPFYPTKGSRLSVNSELAGGLFGGSVNFHKQRLEGRVYVASLLKGLTTMVRARIGVLGEYPDQNLPVPPYERFRLGGGTTIDPLRGYDDYMVVPGKFVQDVGVSFRTDTTFSGTDTLFTRVPIRFQKVRYPGGRFMTAYSVEQQFPIAHPLHGVLFFDAGNTWDLLKEARPFDLKLGAGFGIRLEIPLLGNVGFDYGYGFHRDDGPRFVGHFLLGQTSF